jgi:hypothetical protein
MPRVSARDFDSAHRSQRVTVNREGRPVSYLKVRRKRSSNTPA